jgi:hypothetical protein
MEKQDKYFLDEPTISWLNEKCRAYIVWFNLYTLVVWVLLLCEFFTKSGVILPRGLMTVYIVFLTAYTGQKELSRWKLGHNYKRIWGELWVYTWLFTGLLIFGINAFRPDFAVPTVDLAGILSTTIAYFSGSEFSKKAYKAKHPKE